MTDAAAHQPFITGNWSRVTDELMRFHTAVEHQRPRPQAPRSPRPVAAPAQLAAGDGLHAQARRVAADGVAPPRAARQRASQSGDGRRQQAAGRAGPAAAKPAATKRAGGANRSRSAEGSQTNRAAGKQAKGAQPRSQGAQGQGQQRKRSQAPAANGRARPAAARPVAAARRYWVPAAPFRTALLGIVWAVVLFGAAEVGITPFALVLAIVAFVAALSTERRWAPAGDRTTRRLSPVAGAVGFIVPLLAIAGPKVAVAGLVVGAVAIAAAGLALPAGVNLARRTAVGLYPAVGAAFLVLALYQDRDTGFVLMYAVLLYDMASFMMGRGRTGGALGVISGIITIVVLAVFTAAILVPPFTGRSPWVLLGLVAVFAPLGVALADRTAPARTAGLARLDSLILAGPAYVIGVSVVLHFR